MEVILLRLFILSSPWEYFLFIFSCFQASLQFSLFIYICFQASWKFPVFVLSCFMEVPPLLSYFIGVFFSITSGMNLTYFCSLLLLFSPPFNVFFKLRFPRNYASSCKYYPVYPVYPWYLDQNIIAAMKLLYSHLSTSWNDMEPTQYVQRL